MSPEPRPSLPLFVEELGGEDVRPAPLTGRRSRACRCAACGLWVVCLPFPWRRCEESIINPESMLIPGLCWWVQRASRGSGSPGLSLPVPHRRLETGV